MPTPQNKRKRTNSSSAESPNLFENSVTRSESYYFDDGNIVLIAENVAFRVHKGLMAHHSEVFRDMLALGNQPSDGETFEGCPVVRMSDSLGDILMLLRTLYDYTPLGAEDVDTLAGIIRMSTKYLIEPLRTSAMQVLREIYPATLKDWDDYQAATPDPESVVDRGPPQSVLGLVGAEILLPAAHYELCDFHISEILEFEPPLPQQVFKTHCRGREIIATKFSDFFKTHIYPGTTNCGHACLSAWKFLEEEAIGLVQDSAYINAPNPLHGLQKISKMSDEMELCTKCGLKLLVAIKIERQNIWASLPDTFGLGSWEILLNAT